MNKLSSITYNRLLAQAEEAKELKLEELADGVLNAIGPASRDEEEPFIFSHSDLRDAVHKSLWKIAIEVISYHDHQKSDIQKVGAAIDNLTDNVLNTIHNSLNIVDHIGPGEPILPGQSS
jgi:hypothetical protein